MVQTLIEKMVNLLFFDMFYIIAAICQAGFIGKYCDEQCMDTAANSVAYVPKHATVFPMVVQK